MLHDAFFGEGAIGGAGGVDDEVVEQADLEPRRKVFEFLCRHDVRLARRRVAGGGGAVEFTATLDGHGGTTVVSAARSTEGIEPGTYENAELEYQVAKTSEGGTVADPELLLLTIPRLVVEQ